MYPLSSTAQFKVNVLEAGVVTVDGDYLVGRVLDSFLKLEELIQRGAFKRLSPHSPALKLIFHHNDRQINLSVGYMKYDGDIAALPPVWCLQLCVQPHGMFPMQRDVLNLYGLLILEEDQRENVFRRLGYESCLMTDSEWDGAKREVIIIK